MDKFAKFFERHRIGLALAIIAMSATCAVGVAQLGFEDQPRGIFRTDDHSFRQLEEVFEQFGTDELNCMVLVESEDLFAASALTALQSLAADLKDVVGVKEILSIADSRLLIPKPLPHPLLPNFALLPAEIAQRQAEIARQEALAHPLVAGRLLTADARKTLMIVRLSGGELTIDDLQPVVGALREVLDEANQTGPLRARMTGLPSIRVDVFTVIQRDYRLLLWLGAAMAFSMALLIFRQLSAALIVFLASMMGVFWIVGVMGLVGEKITVITTVLPTLVAVIGLTDAIHLMFEYRHQRSLGFLPRESAGNTIRYLGVACGLTSLTTAIGFSSLAASNLEIIQRFGLACAVGALMVFASVITLVPLLCGTGLVRIRKRSLSYQAGSIWTKISQPLIDFVLRWRWLVTGAGIVLTICLAAVAMKIRPDSHLSENMPPDSEAALVLHDVDQHFGGILTVSVVVQWPARLDWNASEVREALDGVHVLLAETPGLHYPTSIRDFLALLPGWAEQKGPIPAHQLAMIPAVIRQSLIRPELKRLLVTARLQDHGIARQKQMLKGLQQRLQSLNAQPRLQGFELLLTGSSVVASENISQMLVDLGQSLGLATIVIFVVLVIAYRSLRLGLICLLPNLLPLLITAAVIVFSGQSLRGATVLVFTVCLGVAVDDTIHFVSRFRRELEVDEDIEAALKRTFTAVGAALMTSTLILLVGFSSSLVSDLPHIRIFVGLSCVAIFSALLGDLLILPAMLACFYGSPGSRGKTTGAASIVD